MPNFLQIAQQFIGNAVQNGSIQQAQYPWTGSAVNAIMNNDAKTGQELANNIISSYGFSSMEEAAKVGLQNLFGRK